VNGSAVIQKVPPQSLEAEQATLGSMLLERDAIARVVDLLDSDDFYQEGHRALYGAMISLFNEGTPVDLVTLGERLSGRGQLEQVGGMAYLTSLLEAAPTAANVERYARIVRWKATLRNLIRAAHEVTELAYGAGDEDIDEVVDLCEQKIFAVSERTLVPSFSSMRELLGEAFDRIEEMSRTHLPGTGVLTGFTEMDALTSGLQSSDLIILAARPSMGKTALALNIACHAALNQQKKVGIFSLEMAKEQLALRLLCSQAAVDQQSVRQGFTTDKDMARITKAADLLYKAPIFVDDSPVMTVLQMRGKARRLRAEHGLDLLIVDYLQLMQGYGKFENRNQEISQVARSLKALARELQVPVVACSQLSRAVETRGQAKRPQLSDLRESGSIEQEADVVAFIYRPFYYGEEELKRAGYMSTDSHVAEIILAKQRNGPTGITRLAWTDQYVRFDELEEYREPEED